MSNYNQQLYQIRAAHKSAQPSSQNPAWKNLHQDMTIVMSYIDEIQKVLVNHFESVDPKLDRQQIVPGCELDLVKRLIGQSRSDHADR
jgi:hypothetical protein